MSTRPVLAALGFLIALQSCVKPLSGEEASALVRRYNDRIIEAFRTGDPLLVARVAGPAEQRKLLGLIGSKTDMGITLDARLDEFKVLKVEPGKDQVLVMTEERWYYRDRRIGTGEQVGQDSADHYFMTYILRKPEGLWVVDEIRFTRPPEVGRTEVEPRAPATVFHGEPAPGTEGHRTLQPAGEGAP